jgi:GAF domain-containing protein
MQNDPRIMVLRTKVATYGKENQEELLYALAEGARLFSDSHRVRIYLEDLTRGVLSCVHVSGEMAEEIREQSFPIISTETVVSSVFVSQYPVDFRNATALPDSPDGQFAERFGFRASYIMPVVSLGKSIGVLCIDSGPGSVPISAQGKSQLADFTGFVAGRLDQARIYHQQLQLARRLEELKAREAAGMM